MTLLNKFIKWSKWYLEDLKKLDSNVMIPTLSFIALMSFFGVTIYFVYTDITATRITPDPKFNLGEIVVVDEFVGIAQIRNTDCPTYKVDKDNLMRIPCKYFIQYPSGYSEWREESELYPNDN